MLVIDIFEITNDYFDKIPSVSVNTVRTRGGNKKFRALRLENGNFAWASEV